MMFLKRQRPAWEHRLDVEVSKLRDAHRYREVTFNRLKDIVGAPSEGDLVRALAKRVADGSLRVLYRVVSPQTKASLAVFESPLDVPGSILDQSTGEEIDIDPYRNVEPVYVSEVAGAQ